MKRIVDEMSLEEEIALVNKYYIPLEQFTDEMLLSKSYKDLVSIKDQLEILLFMLDLKRFCDFVRSNKRLNEKRKMYRRNVKKTYTKINHLIENEKKELPELVQVIINEFGGKVE